MASDTLRLIASPIESAEAVQSIEKAASLLRSGGTVAFPTETVYGLGANALDSSAVARIFAAKGRPSWDPLIVHIAHTEMLRGIVLSIPESAQRWMEHFWPGPLTLLLPRSAHVPDAVTAGRPLVGIRMPAHPVAQALLRAAGVPVAAPSANLFGHVSPTTADHVLADLDGRIDAVLDGGAAEHGLESTVVDPCSSPCRIYRPGAVTLDQLRSFWPAVQMFQPVSQAEPPEALPSPGVGMRHYAPQATLFLVEDGPALGRRLLEAVQAAGFTRCGLLLPGGLLTAAQCAQIPAAVKRFQWGQWSSPQEMGRLLFTGMRALDREGVEMIVCPVPPGEGIGVALRDRLRKAAMNP